MSVDNRPEAVIFDVDGTLVDVSSIRHFVVASDPKFTYKNFDAFHGSSADCPPNEDVLKAFRDVKDSGGVAIVVTARMERHSFVTTLWLKEHGAEDYDEIYFRRNYDGRPDHEIKREILRKIEKKYRVVHAWDDNPSIIALWESEGIGVTHVPGWIPDVAPAPEEV